jgi:secretion/DNA translocation related CpaE-like protein
MTSRRWILLLTDDPLIARPIARLAGSVGLAIRSDGDPAAIAPPGCDPPALVVLGADRIAEPLSPAATTGPRVLVATGDPEDRFWRSALALRAEQVVLLPEGEQLLFDRLSRLAERPDRRALVIAVTGGCGGAGSSVLAAGLARAATRVSRSLLIEVDRLGSGADLLLGAEDEPGLRWPDLVSARGELPPGSLLGAVPVVDGLHVLSWDRSPDPVEVPAAAGAAVLATAAREFGIVVLDLPRWLDPAAVVASRAADLALLVVPAQIRAAAAARRVATGLLQHLAEVRVIVRGPASTGLRAEAVAEALGLPLAGELKPEPGLRAALDRGDPPGLRVRGPLATLCRQLLAAELAERALEPGDAR